MKTFLSLTGNTPLIHLPHLSQQTGAQVYAKLEWYNPTASIKDRVVAYMLDRAEKEGKIKPGYTIVEASSGNTGTSLAMMAPLKGYKAAVFVKETISSAKKENMLQYGAKVVPCPASASTDSDQFYINQAIAFANASEDRYYLDQNNCEWNALAHYLSIGKEIWEQSEGKVTHMIACASTGGTVCGISQYLKEKNPAVQTVAVDAAGSVLRDVFEKGYANGGATGSSSMEGVGKKFVTKNLNFRLIDRFLTASDERSAQYLHQLMRNEGVMPGFSSGATLDALHQLTPGLRPTDHIVLIFPDHGLKYLDKVYNSAWLESKHIALTTSNPIKINA